MLYTWFVSLLFGLFGVFLWLVLSVAILRESADSVDLLGYTVVLFEVCCVFGFLMTSR